MRYGVMRCGVSVVGADGMSADGMSAGGVGVMGVCDGDTTLHPKRATSDHTTSHIHSTQESTGHTVLTCIHTAFTCIK